MKVSLSIKTPQNCSHFIYLLSFLFFSFFSQPVLSAPAKVALIHSNPVLNDVATNVTTLTSLVEEAFNNNANIIVTPELATTGFSITTDQVLNGLGFTVPYPELNDIRDLAIQHNGYVLVAIAEVKPDQTTYNTVVLFGPSGLITTGEKRGLSGWHERGTTEFNVVTTPYGDIGFMICSDSYLPDWLRILTLKGADLVFLPTNWWGAYEPINHQIWQTRARENGVWFMAANRWGEEVDERYGFPFTYDMNDAPSVVITPNGDIELFHIAQNMATPADTILYYTVNVPNYRIGTTTNPAYSLNARKPSAYVEIANSYYRPDLGDVPAPGLPTAGITQVGSMTYEPVPNAGTNLQTIQNLWNSEPQAADVLVLPGQALGDTILEASVPTWYNNYPWSALQGFVENEGLQLLVTSAIEKLPDDSYRNTLMIFKPNQTPELRGQIHDSVIHTGTGTAPAAIDLPNARIGVLLGRDALFPETATALAKSGVDILLITSIAGANWTSHNVNSPNYFWEPTMLQRLWKTRANEVMHIAASDWTGHGAIFENTYGILGRISVLNADNRYDVLDLDSNGVRTKYLNAYYPFDLDALVGAGSP